MEWIFTASDLYRRFEDTGSTAILYIAAWQGEKEKIWYEYTSQKFMNLLGCENSEVAEVFRDSIIDCRIYKDLDVDVGIRKEVKNREELDYDREALREEGKKAGTIEADYKLAVNSNGDEIVSAMSLTAEKRDPYTAGHQKRTTELAMALAGEMGLSEHQIIGFLHSTFVNRHLTFFFLKFLFRSGWTLAAGSIVIMAATQGLYPYHDRRVCRIDPALR